MSPLLKPEFAELDKIIPRDTSCMVPVYTQISADLLTPVSAYLKLSHKQDYSFLFESVEGGAKIGRYSFLGAGPKEIVRTGDNYDVRGDPLVYLEKKLSSVKFIETAGVPMFTGGAVGYVSYDCIKYFEPRTATTELKDVLDIPEAMFLFFDQVVIFDHLHHVIKVVGHYLHTPGPLSLKKYEHVARELAQIVLILNGPSIPLPEQPTIATDNTEMSNTGKRGYEDSVRLLKHHITQGDIIQAVPSQRISRTSNVHPFNIYRELRSLNPSPYMYYLNLKDFQIVGASPEMMCKVENQVVTTHPIAGTRKRGASPALDEALAKELLADEKECAEHVMLVDLGRNDVNRVCQPSTVTVDSLMKIERYSHVMHIVSQVSGTLRPECTPFDAFRSIFPAGTVSGAPKIRAIELVSQCEKEKRGVYAGAVGYFAYSGGIDTAIAIRTMVCKNGIVHLQAGAGIVYDSVPESEYLETLAKLRSNMTAISRAEEHYTLLQQQENLKPHTQHIATQ